MGLALYFQAANGGLQTDPIAEITHGLSSLALDNEVRDGQTKAAKKASTSSWGRLTFDVKKHIASFLDAKDLFTCFQLLEKCLGSVSSATTAELQLSDKQAMNLAKKLQNRDFAPGRDVHFWKIANRVINLSLNRDQTDEEVTNTLHSFPRLQEFSYVEKMQVHAQGTFLAHLPPTIKRVCLKITKLGDTQLQELKKCPALEVLEVRAMFLKGASFRALPLSLHTLKLDCNSYFLSYENLVAFIESSSQRRLRLENQVANNLMDQLLGAETEETAKTIAQKVSHLDFSNNQAFIFAGDLVETLRFFENLEELVLPSLENSGCCLEMVPRSLGHLDKAVKSQIKKTVMDQFSKALFNFSAQHPQCKVRWE